VRDNYTAELGQNRLEGVLNQKISDDVAIRVGTEVYGQSKGFYYDPNANKYYDSTSGWIARGQIRYRHGPLDVNLLGDVQDLRLPSFVNTFTVPGGGVNAQLPLGFIQPRFVVPHSGQDGLRQRQQRAILTANYDFGWATLASTTMVSHSRTEQQYAAAIDLATEATFKAQGEIGVYPYGQTATDVSDRTFYQDLHLTGKTLSDRLTWTAGGEALIQRDQSNSTLATSPCAQTVAASLCTGTPIQPICVKPLPTSPVCPAVFPNSFGANSQTRQRFNSYAVYAALTYTLGNFSLDAEGRYSWDNKVATQTIYSLYTTRVTKPATTFDFRASQPSYTVTASYKFSDATGTLLYAKVGTGYRAGGVNNGVFNAAAPNPLQFTYGDENTIGYEVGVKSTIVHNVFVRVAAYLSRTTDAIASINDGCTVTNACGQAQTVFNVNAGTIHARGIEAAVNGNFRIGGGQFSVDLNAANQRAVYAEVPAGAPGLPILGSSVAQLPDWTMSANLKYQHAITGNASGFINLGYTGQRGGSQDTVTIATPFIPISDFDDFSLNFGVNLSKVQVSLFIHNLTNEVFQTLKFQQAGFPLSARYNTPRTVGGTVSYRW
jgi:iron complex outermembrane receptor protein